MHTVVDPQHVAPLQVLGTEVRFLAPPSASAGAFSAMEVTVPEGAGPPPHDHDWAEAYYVLEGALQFTLAEGPVLVPAGSFLLVPGRAVHGFTGVARRSRVLIFDAPAQAEGFFVDVDREVHAPADRAKVPDIGARNGIRFAPR